MSKDFTVLEPIMMNLVSNTDVKANLKHLKDTLNTLLPQLQCQEVIITNDATKPFGASVYPDYTEMMSVATSVVNDNNRPKKGSINDVYFKSSKPLYVIELDGKVMYDRTVKIKLNEKEMVALVLHEIGHVMLDKSTYDDLRLIYLDCLKKTGATAYDKKSSAFSPDIILLYFIDGLNKSKTINYRLSLSNEQLADNFVIQCGYGKYLESLLQKFAKYQYTNFTKPNVAKAVESEARAYIQVQDSLDTRRDVVHRALDAESKLQKGFVARMIDKVKNKIFGDKAVSENTLITDMIIDRQYKRDILDEGFISKYILNPIKTSQQDIDALTIEYEMLDDYDDKTVLVYKIHKRLTQLKDARDKVSDDKQKVSIVDTYSEQLEDLLKKVMKFKPVEKTYGVFLKYPKGYEG